MENSADATPAPQILPGQFAIDVRTLMRRIIARNPFYLVSAGLLLYGINQLTTDPKLVGAEFSMLRFNFCALIVYEVLLATTAIALVRRGIWYDALLLVGLANVFIIVPFSLISRAVFLNPGLALVMSISGALLAVGKFWAFKRYIPSLNLPARLLILGSALLLANASAPLIPNAIADNPEKITQWFNAIWLAGLPLFAGLANLLPHSVEAHDSPAQRRWLPLTFYTGWMVVTACHFGGIGYSLGFDWNLSLLAPVAWVMAWTLYLRRWDFTQKLNSTIQEALLFVPLVLPLLATGKSILPILASVNLACYLARLLLRTRSQLDLLRLLGSVAILLSGLPMSRLETVIPEISQAGWMIVCTAFCFFWLIFLSRDPRIALGGALGLLVICFWFAHDFARLAIQVGLVSILMHSLRWEDRLGATIFRTLAGVLWIFLSESWLRESTPEARWAIYITASVLLTGYAVHVVIQRHGRPWTILFFAVVVLVLEPGISGRGDLAEAPRGFLAIGGSFLLFGLGSLVAFSKSKKQNSRDELASP